MIRERQRWHGLREGMGCFEIALPIAAWEKTLRVVVYESPCITKRKRTINSTCLTLTTVILSIQRGH